MIARWTAPGRLRDILIEEEITIDEEMAKRICEKMGWSKRINKNNASEAGE